jgi:hypothetical protein
LSCQEDSNDETGFLGFREGIKAGKSSLKDSVACVEPEVEIDTGGLYVEEEEEAWLVFFAISVNIGLAEVCVDVEEEGVEVGGFKLAKDEKGTLGKAEEDRDEAKVGKA